SPRRHETRLGVRRAGRAHLARPCGVVEPNTQVAGTQGRFQVGSHRRWRLASLVLTLCHQPVYLFFNRNDTLVESLEARRIRVSLVKPEGFLVVDDLAHHLGSSRSMVWVDAPLDEFCFE